MSSKFDDAENQNNHVPGHRHWLKLSLSQFVILRKVAQSRISCPAQIDAPLACCKCDFALPRPTVYLGRT
jgi:hypothetical protein